MTSGTAGVRVLVTDSSSVVRDLLRAKLSEDPAIDVVATATDPHDARGYSCAAP